MEILRPHAERAMIGKWPWTLPLRIEPTDRLGFGGERACRVGQLVSSTPRTVRQVGGRRPLHEGDRCGVLGRRLRDRAVGMDGAQSVFGAEQSQQALLARTLLVSVGPWCHRLNQSGNRFAAVMLAVCRRTVPFDDPTDPGAPVLR